MQRLLEVEWGSSPMEIGVEVYRIVTEVTGVRDPYREIKMGSNDLALKKYPYLKRIVERSNDPLKTAIKISISGNIIDFGALESFNIEDTISKVLQHDLNERDYRVFERKLEEASSIVFFADNAGEIVFDKVLVEELIKYNPGIKVIFVVRGFPIINDATMEDAVFIGLNKIPNVIVEKFGSDELSVESLKMGLHDAENWVSNASFSISKGQGNYELFSGFRNTFFLLVAKCPVIARSLGVKVGDPVLKYFE